MGRNRSALIYSAAALFPLGFLGIFFAYPLGAVIHRSFSGQGLLNTWSASSTWEIVWFTFWQATASTALTFLLALPMAYILGRFKFKGQRVLSALLIVPFVLPTVVVASAMLAVQDRLRLDGILHHSIWAILIAHAFFNYALVARIVGSFWAQLDFRPELAARVLGAGKWQTFFRITMPRLRPAFISAAGLVFFFSFTSFGVILILGGPTKATLDTEIWRFGAQRLEFDVAAALTLLQIIMVAAMAYFNSWSTRYIPGSSAGVDTRLRPKKMHQWSWVGVALFITAGLLLAPMAIMTWESFSPRGAGGASFESYRALFGESGRISALFVEPFEAIQNSLIYALTATGIAVALGTVCAYIIFYQRQRSIRLFLEPLFFMPLGVSALALGFGYLIALDEPPLDLRTSWIIVPLAHSLLGLPFVMRAVLSHLHSIDERLRWSARVLGASSAQIIARIDLPVIFRGVLTGAGFVFAISLGEFGAASFLARPDRPTIPLAIYNLLSAPGSLSFGQAMALSVILMLLITGVVLAIDGLRPRKSDIGIQIL